MCNYSGKALCAINLLAQCRQVLWLLLLQAALLLLLTWLSAMGHQHILPCKGSLIRHTAPTKRQP